MARKRISISVDEELLEKVDEFVANTYKYADRSHFIEYAMSQLYNKENSTK